MRKLLTITLIGVIGLALANTGNYEKIMLKNITALYKAETIQEYQNVINTLDRIGMTEKDKWEPYYYSTFGNILMSTKTKELKEKDSYLDEAQSRLDKAKSTEANNVEIITLQGFIYMMRLAADPANRGQVYAGKAFETFNGAVALDENNPRALILRAQMKEGTANFFGTSTDEACNEAVKAMSLFDNQTNTKTSIAPSWGRSNAEKMIKRCGINTKTSE